MGKMGDGKYGDNTKNWDDERTRRDRASSSCSDKHPGWKEVLGLPVALSLYRDLKDDCLFLPVYAAEEIQVVLLSSELERRQ